MVFQTLTMPGDAVYEKTYDLGMNDRKAMHEQGWPKMAFLEHHFGCDPTNWWAANHAGVQAMLRSSGMRIVKRGGDDLYLCEPDTEIPSCVTTWNRAELLAATGRPWSEPASGISTS